MSIALITGISGQDGANLSRLLLEKGYEVHGIIRRSSSFNTARIDEIFDKLHLHYGDLHDSNSLNDILINTKPDEVYHLGAQSHVKVSFEIPEYTFDIAATGTLRLLEAVRRLNLLKPVKFYNAASSEMFGKVMETPQTEKTPFYPRSPYACAKVAAFYLTVNYREAYNLFACNGILFNHEGIYRGETFVTRKITRAATRICLGQQNDLHLGNLDAKRDWGDSEDFVRAMWMMLQHDHPDDFVVATGETHSIKDFLDEAFGYLNLDWKKYVVVDEKYKRPTEVDLLMGDPTKAKEHLGWVPNISFKKLVTRMVDFDLKLALREKTLQHQTQKTL